MEQSRRAGIYTRISEDRLGAGLGVDRQERDCRALVARKGWVVAGVYVDNDRSASSGRVRPEYRRLLEDLRAGVVDAVVAWHPDRLHRSPRELEAFIDLVESTHALVATCTAGDYDLATPSGRQVARILGAVARGEVERTAERIRRKGEELAEEGRWSGGTPGFGYRAGGDGRLAVVPEEAELIRWGVDQVLSGVSLSAVVRGFERSGLRGARGGRWDPRTVRGILTSPRIAGKRVFRGQVVGDGQWEPIVPLVQLRQVVALVSVGQGTRPAGRNRLLAGLLRCGRCGQRLHSARHSVPAKPSVATFACESRRGGCGTVVVREVPVERWAVEIVCAALASPALNAVADAGADARRAELVDELAMDEAELHQLARDLADRRITRGEWQTARQILADRVAVLEFELMRLAGPTARDLGEGGPDALRRRWDTLDHDVRRAIVTSVLAAIEVMPATRRGCRFDPSRLRPVYRAG
jgi:DNA invertase Pin-like site-specific DNA recombinase